MRGAVLKRISEITTEFDPTTIRPQVGSPVVFVGNGKQGIKKVCGNFAVDIISIKVSPNILKGAVAHKLLKVDYQCLFRKNKCSVANVEINAELVHIKTQGRENVVINHKEHTLSFTPTLRGRHELRVSVSGQSVQGSPFPLSVAPDPASLGKPMRVIKGLKGPYGIAISCKGHVIVTENGSHQVSIYNKQWRKIRSFGGKGSGQGQFNQPVDVTVDDADDMYVVDKENHRVQKLTLVGEFIASVGSYGNGQLQFVYPFGVTYNKSSGKIYILSFYKVQVLNTDLTLHSTFGKKGNLRCVGGFDIPVGISCDATGNVLVTDSELNRIQVFTPDGKFIHGLCNPMQFKDPRNIFTDHDTGVMYVTEGLGHRVSMLTATGEFIRSFGMYGSGDGQFKYPVGIAIDEDEKIIVADKNNNRLQIF